MTVSVLTCTFNRPEAFALLERWMAAQTIKPDQWLVLDDGEVPVTCTMGQQHVLIPEMRGPSSMVNKLRHALENNLITGDILIFAEDDDFYAPGYLEWCHAALATNLELIGEGRNVYYNVRHRWWFDHNNTSHASLCATSLKRSAFPALLKVCVDSVRRTEKDRPFIDSQLWAQFMGRKRVFDPNALGRRLTVGIKSMPGALGYGSGHDKDSGWAIRDPRMDRLKQLLGSSAEAYEKYYDGPVPGKLIPQAPEIPLIEVHIVAYNEEEILPYTLRHYKTFASRIIVHDGGSTDRTRAICAEYGIDVLDWDTAGKINDELLRILKETCWNGTDAAWVIMVDADEFVHFPGGVELTLKKFDQQDIAAVKCKGFEMESPTYPDTMGQIYEQVDHGSPDDRWYGKPCLLAPGRIQSIHFTHGAHECIVTRKNGRREPSPKVPHNPPAMLLHYHHLGPVQRVGTRYDGNKSRFSDENKKHGWGWQGDGLSHSIQKRAAILAQRRKVL